MIKHFFTKQFLGFIAVGGLAAICNWVSRIILSQSLPLSWAVVVAYLIGMTTAFLLNSFFVFQESKKVKHKQARDFILINLGFLPLVIFATVKINDILNHFGVILYAKEFAHAIAIALPMFFTFLFYKFVAFKKG